MRGELRPGARDGREREWCDPDVLRRLRRASIAALRQEIEPTEQAALERFALSWHGIDRYAGGGEGRDGPGRRAGMPLDAGTRPPARGARAAAGRGARARRRGSATCCRAGSAATTARGSTACAPRARRRPNLFVVRWRQLVRANPQWLAGDGVHVDAIGYRARARAFARQIAKCP